MDTTKRALDTPVGLDHSDHEGEGKNTVLYTHHFAKSTHIYCFQCTALSQSAESNRVIPSLTESYLA
nr:MAG TPA: hypothetical protein [Caudoviricetes sp.]